MTDREKFKILQRNLAKDQDEAAFETIYVICFPSLLRFAYSIIKSHESAEEIVSDVLLKIWHLKKDIEKIDDFRLYLYVSTRNTALNYLKKQQHKPVLGIFDINDSAVWLKADDLTPEQLFISSELLQKIQSAIHQLPPRCQLIYKLIKEDGLKYREVAELLHISMKTIEAQMGIALKKMHEALTNL